jgi:5,10-methylenetetrahydrofolate reductase
MPGLAEALASGRFVVTAEFGPPREPDADIVRAGAHALAGTVDAVNVTDNQAATVKLSALAASALLIAEGLEPILQITARDRNLMAIQGELLGAWALGVHTVLALSGDPLKVGPTRRWPRTSATSTRSR